MTQEAFPAGESKDSSIETTLKGRGAGAIFYIRQTDQFMFFLRDAKDWIPFPDMIDIIGGHLETKVDGTEETAEEGALREFAEELDDLDTGEPFRPEGLVPFRQWVDDRHVEQNIFGCVLEKVPNLHLKEGQRLVFLDRAELAETDFAFGYNRVVNDFAATIPTAT